MTLTQKTCLITGCSEGGAGAALAKAFHDKGYHVFATARTTSKIPRSIHEARNITILELDVTISSSIVKAAKTVQQQTGGSLDVLINNAGVGMNMPALDITIAKMKEMFDINFFAAFEMIQMFIPMLVSSGGCIVNNASIGGVKSLVFTGTYGASKAAMIQAGEALRLEVAPLGVRVLTLVAGGIQTPFVHKFEPLILPEKSYFHSIKDIIDFQPKDIPMAVPPESFAADVLRKVEGGVSGKVWIGGGSLVARLSFWLLPSWAVDRILLNMKQPFNKQLEEERKKHV